MPRVFSEIQLVNGSTGDPVLYIDYPDVHNALLFDAGDNARLAMSKLADLTAVFITHHHVDHFIGLDRIVRANIDADKTLSLFGPIGTIAKVYDRIKSYVYPFFPFQRIALDVHEIHDDHIVVGRLECTRRFPQPVLERRDWHGGVVFENDDVAVEAVHVDHTVPTLAYAMVEKPGFHFDTRQLERGLLRPGKWIDQTLRMLRDGVPEEAELDIAGGRFRLKDLAEQYFRRSPGARVAFIVDTYPSPEVQPRLMALARKAHILYCDSFYAEAQAKAAAKHRHMTATRAAELAVAAGVDQLCLIHFSTRYRGRYQKLVDEAQAIFPKTTAEILPGEPNG